jgi:hypothetical protein
VCSEGIGPGCVVHACSTPEKIGVPDESATMQRRDAKVLYDVDRHRRHAPVSVIMLPVRVYVFVLRSNPWGERKGAARIGRMATRNSQGEFFYLFQDVSVLKSSLNPRALISAVYFNVLGKKERRARVEQISFYICQSESLGP